MGADHIAAVEEGFYVTEADPLQAEISKTVLCFLNMAQSGTIGVKSSSFHSPCTIACVFGKVAMYSAFFRRSSSAALCGNARVAGPIRVRVVEREHLAQNVLKERGRDAALDGSFIGMFGNCSDSY